MPDHKNNTHGNHNAMIDDCGNSGVSGGLGNEDDDSSNNGAGVSFVQEWINTYAFISREFILLFHHQFFINLLARKKTSSD